MSFSFSKLFQKSFITRGTSLTPSHVARLPITGIKSRRLGRINLTNVRHSSSSVLKPPSQPIQASPNPVMLEEAATKQTHASNTYQKLAAEANVFHHTQI